MMAAAATPLLRALRVQKLRGHVWGCGAAVRGAASGARQLPPLLELSRTNPELPVSAPELPVSAPELPVSTPQLPVSAPELPGITSELPVSGPEVSVSVPEVSGALVGGAEPRLVDLGLGGSTPVGLIQNFLEFLHLELGLPWWGAIAAGTVGARLALLPLVLRGQREAARVARHLPHLQKLSQRLAEARRGADPNRVAVAYSELVSYQRRHDVNPLRGFLVPLVQTPLFVSFFLALQGMAAAPLPGLRVGGLCWFIDLAAPDPIYVLPLLVTASTCLVLELGAEAGVAAPGSGAVRQILRLLPLLFLPFILHFPTAVFTYWLTSNGFSLLQTALLRIPALRARVGVAPPLAPPPGAAPPPKAGILRQLRKD